MALGSSDAGVAGHPLVAMGIAPTDVIAAIPFVALRSPTLGKRRDSVVAKVIVGFGDSSSMEAIVRRAGG